MFSFVLFCFSNLMKNISLQIQVQKMSGSQNETISSKQKLIYISYWPTCTFRIVTTWEKNSVCRTKVSDSRTYHKATIIKTMCYWHETWQTNQWSRLKFRNRSGQLVFKKASGNLIQKRKCFEALAREQLDRCKEITP